MSRFVGSTEAPTVSRSPPTRRATIKPYAASILGHMSGSSTIQPSPEPLNASNNGLLGNASVLSKIPAARSLSPSKKKPFVFAIKSQKEGFGTPPPLPPVTPPAEHMGGEHSEPIYSTISKDEEQLNLLNATYWLKLHRMNPRWLNLTMALWGIVVGDPNRSVDAASVKSFIDAMEWRMNGDVTEGEFLTIYCEWINMGSNPLPKRHLIGLHSFRNILIEKKVSEDTLNLFICLLLNENSRTLLNLPLNYKPSGSKLCSISSNLEVCSRKWLALSEELFFTLDTAGYGGLQYDQMFFLASTLTMGLRSWTNESEAAADLSVSMLTAISSNLIRDALPPGGSITISNGSSIDVNKAKNAHVFPRLETAILYTTVTLPMFKRLLIKLGIGESSLEGLIAHVRRCVALIAATLARWSEESWSSQISGIFIPKSDASLVLKSCFPVESTPTDWNSQMSPPGPPRLWQHVVLKVAGSSPSAISTQNHPAPTMNDNSNEGLPFVLSFLMSEGDRAVPMAWRAHGESVSGIDAHNPSPEHCGSMLVHTAAWKVFGLYKKLGGFPHLSTSSGIEPKSGFIPPLEVRRDPIYQLILAALMEYKSLQLALSTALVESALDYWGFDTSVRAVQEGDPHSSVVALACASLVPSSEDILKEIQNYEKAHLPPPPSPGRRFSMSAISPSITMESLSQEPLTQTYTFDIQNSPHEVQVSVDTHTMPPIPPDATLQVHGLTDTENMDKSNHVEKTPYSNRAVSHLFTPVEDAPHIDQSRGGIDANHQVSRPLVSVPESVVLRKRLQDVLDDNVSLPSSWKDLAAKANWQSPGSTTPSTSKHDDIERDQAEENSCGEIDDNHMDKVAHSGLFKEVDLGMIAQHVYVEKEDLNNDTKVVNDIALNSVIINQTSSEDMEGNINAWLFNDKNSFLTAEERAALVRLMRPGVQSNEPAPQQNVNIGAPLPVAIDAIHNYADNEPERFLTNEVIPEDLQPSLAVANQNLCDPSSHPFNQDPPQASSSDSSVSTAHTLSHGSAPTPADGYPSSLRDTNKTLDGDIQQDNEAVSTASSLVELLQQGHSAGVYAQSLRDLLRKMSRKNSKMQLKSLEDVIRLGENILENESRARASARSRSPAGAAIGTRAVEPVERDSVIGDSPRNNSPNKRSSLQTRSGAPLSAEARRSLIRPSNISNAASRSYQVDVPPSIIKSASVETVKSTVVRNFMSPGPESVSSSRSGGLSAKPLAAQTGAVSSPTVNRYGDLITPIKAELTVEGGAQVSRTPGRAPGRTPPSPGSNGRGRATKSRVKPPPTPSYAQRVFGQPL